MTKSQEFKDFEYQGWQQAAEQYHCSFGALTNQMIEPLLNAVKAQARTKLLDIATGPGYVSAQAAQRQCQVVGLDFSEAMLAKARQLNPDLKWVQGDAESLPFADDEFDAVVMNFGILHLAEPQKAINETFRVLRVPGNFAFTAWDILEKSAGFQIIYQAIQTYGELNNPIPEGPPFFYFSQPENCLQGLAEAGFINPLVKQISLSWELDSADRLFEAFYKGTARTGGLLRRQPERNLENIRAAVHEALVPYTQSNKVVLPMSALVISGEKI
ncbi:MAG TPA: SAM-dependent methyltransferase [Cyanobacteria bacterium UBA8803]|nr:SAM-dependent methyltransferase [Cyanobacteria bacterium UBA9273]HBL62117.1 SAM-dependent methyltransferase [Cyanobacteria bacterium UBA8803]